MTTSLVAALRRIRTAGHVGRRQRPSELALVLAAAEGWERAELMQIISRHDAWDEVEGHIG